ncbi:MAG TPA: DNA (cytosine-5-)-methyltransferase [Thermoleophilia bacterium]|nr:DNA (cytosine-5-)-methyltransferase [Thermoleophilia bacterium]
MSQLDLFSTPAPHRPAQLDPRAALVPHRWVDLFAGAGGASTGIVSAPGAAHSVVWAANHWQLAVDLHAAAHPTTVHACQDLSQADFSALPAHDFAWASPACQGFSTAATKRLSEKAKTAADVFRATSYAVLDLAQRARPRALVIENVPSMRRWGPGGDGSAYAHWLAGLTVWGYDVHEHVLTASDYGCATERARLFIVAALRDSGIDPELPQLASYRAPAQSIRSILDDVTHTSTRRGDGGWSRWADSSPKVQARIQQGQDRHGPACFVQQVDDGGGRRSLDASLPTITASGGSQYTIADGPWVRTMNTRELARASGFPAAYPWHLAGSERERHRLIGNAVCPPIARALAAALGAQLAHNDNHPNRRRAA